MLSHIWSLLQKTYELLATPWLKLQPPRTKCRIYFLWEWDQNKCLRLKFTWDHWWNMWSEGEGGTGSALMASDDWAPFRFSQNITGRKIVQKIRRNLLKKVTELSTDIIIWLDITWDMTCCICIRSPGGWSDDKEGTISSWFPNFIEWRCCTARNVTVTNIDSSLIQSFSWKLQQFKYWEIV